MSVAQETVVDPSKLVKYKANNHVRFITAASLFDGHDAAINIMRRILQSTGAEVIHLGHNRSVQEVVNAAIQEDVARGQLIKGSSAWGSPAFPTQGAPAH